MRQDVEFQAIKFSTRGLPERDRVAMWREEFGRNVVRVDIEPMSDVPFRAEAKLRALPGLRTVESTGSFMTFNRTSAMTSATDDSVGLVINLDRKAFVSQRDRDIALGAGDAFPIFTHKPAVLKASQHIGLLIPRAPLASRVRDIDNVCTRPIPRTAEPLRLLTSYLRSLPDNLALETPRLRHTVVRHIQDLVALALSPQRPVDEDGLSAVAAARLSMALEHIAEHFEDPGLNVTAVGRRQNISPRYLQRLIETTGMTFTAHLVELRLQRAFTLLTKPRGRYLRISEVALRAGFSDISHFNRQFRARFGETPSGILAMQGRHIRSPV